MANKGIQLEDGSDKVYPVTFLKCIEDFISTDKAIPSYADLDTYTELGAYYCGNAATASTLSNAPYTNIGFRLIVLTTFADVDNQRWQIALSNAGSTGIRVRNKTTSWQTWKTISLS